jgi:hypothetical protein
MNTSMIHESGALILDSSDFQMMDRNLKPIVAKHSQSSSRVGPTKEGPLSPITAANHQNRENAPSDNYADNNDYGGYDDDDDMDGGAWPADPAAFDVASLDGLGHNNNDVCV